VINTAKTLVLLLLVAATTPSPLKAQGRSDVRTSVIAASLDTGKKPTAREPDFDGKPLSYWIKAIHDRDEATISDALDAIRFLGPQGRAAVPELIRLLSDPFRPIELGKDSDTAIATKLYEIEVRSAAIDALAAIGESAAPATLPVIQWVLTVRVIPFRVNTLEEHERFVDLVMLEAEYRTRIIRAIEQFGNPAIPTLEQLLRSPDSERRKLAAIALGTDILPIAGKLLTSRDCDDAQLGITLLSDMAPAVAPIYLSELRAMLTCEAN
jgi:HEAT repeat protein